MVPTENFGPIPFVLCAYKSLILTISINSILMSSSTSKYHTLIINSICNGQLMRFIVTRVHKCCIDKEILLCNI